MLTLRGVRRSDFDRFEPIDVQGKDFLDFFAGHFGPTEPHNFSILDGDKIVLIIGMREMWPGVYDTYTVFSRHWKPIYYRAVARMVKGYLKKMKYDRIQHLISCERPWTHKMARLFGFRNETPDGMEKYIGGEKRYMYAIVN